jgi:hypothetical protein
VFPSHAGSKHKDSSRKIGFDEVVLAANLKFKYGVRL